MESSAAAVGLPEKNEFGALVCPAHPKHRSVVSLRELLAGIEPRGEREQRLDDLERLGHWLSRGPKPPAVPGQDGAVTRLEFLVRALEEMPQARDRVAVCVRLVLAETSAVDLFAEVGLPNDRGLGEETSDRLARFFLPRAPEPNNLGELFERIFRRRNDAQWMQLAEPELITRLARAVGDVWGPLRVAMDEAIALLCARVAALGLHAEIRQRSEVCPPRQSPFYRLAHVEPAALGDEIDQCRRQVAVVRDRLEDFGVSVDVVYCLDTIWRNLNRIEAMLPLLGADTDTDAGTRALAARQLFSMLTAAALREESLRQLAQDNLRLMARKIIERAGRTGEHYVTATRAGYWRMLASAGGGGVITAGTVAVKYMVKWGHFPLFVDGFLTSANYAVSFILMQLCGFTLATKQPSMTAATLADSIKGSASGAGDGRMEGLVTMIARISRSQLIAAIGNVSFVIPAALLVNTFYRQKTGHNFLDTETAAKTLASLHPLESGTIPFAALTGVLLWVSSLGAGWLENWAVYRRLPEAIESHRVGRKIGRRPLAWFARFLEHNISGFGGNISIGLLFGMVPVLGQFFGLSLDIRHLTLAAGSLVMAVVERPEGALVPGSALAWAVLGLVCIGVLNFGVSFLLALAVAFRAREVSGGERLQLLGAVLHRFVTSPVEFFYPTQKALARDAVAARQAGATPAGDH